MKMYKALAMLVAARDGQIPNEADAVRMHGEQAKRILRQLGIKESELNNDYPDEDLDHGLFLVCNHPTEFARQAKASAAWLITRS